MVLHFMRREARHVLGLLRVADAMTGIGRAAVRALPSFSNQPSLPEIYGAWLRASHRRRTPLGSGYRAGPFRLDHDDRVSTPLWAFLREYRGVFIS
ncbi:hypothetical protein Q4543_24420 [Salipiger sp. 1_MG-2023]|nr:hypothetical protein [Salipiger sp. 1_MG-2023]